ncbi:DeoR family transcriptional regulator [Microlunatus endophyticus]|uniref:DeoR family transcriptional regulator n=1 Tax=Microlunatus endophyticus TaxID=1716077 RepID=A0A917RZ06_9ACTN|nr:DeoR/GlpR family DNA-binding transcription regulator [Microlunatus endophyticus]GGL46326.1 DeoR family transcriptional regulator [Microlunatus endophyticus]
MRKVERLSAILDRLAENGSVEVAGLASSFGVSEATVRRDLQSLSRSQHIMRTHGGAVAVETGEEVSTRVKAVLRRNEKKRIGRAAADLVPDGAVVGMTGGSTTLEIARALAERRGITIVTNAINVASELAERNSIRLIVIGGIIRHSLELVGPAAEAMLSNYHLDAAFIGVDGLTAEEGCTTFDEMEAQTDRAFLHRSQRRIVVSDSSKIGRVTFARITHLAEINEIVTDSDVDSHQRRNLEDAGPKLLVV